MNDKDFCELSKIVGKIIGKLPKTVQAVLVAIASGALMFFLWMACGCTGALVIDVSNGDQFQYTYHPWQDEDIEEAAQRVRYWCYEGPRHYGTNRTLKLEMKLYLDKTNLVKKSSYWFRCNAEAVRGK